MSKSSVPYCPTFFGGRFFHDDLYTFSSKFHVDFIKLDILALYYEPQYCIIMSKIAPPLSQCAGIWETAGQFWTHHATYAT